MAPDFKFYGWGHEGEGLDEAEYQRVSRFVAEKLGAEPQPAAAPQASEIVLRSPRIAAPAALARILTQDPHERLLHTYGKSYLETVRAFARDFANAPDYVALPETEADIAALFDWASGAKIAVVPFGAGSSVVGGVEPIVGDGYKGAVSLDMRRLDRVLEVDAVSRAARIQAGILGPRDRGGAEAARLRLAPLSAELRVLDPRRLDRHPLRRPLRHALHAYRRSRRKPAYGDPGGNHGIAPAARLGRGPKSRPHDDRFGGRARRDHRGVDAPAGAAALPRRRRVRLPRFLRRCASRPRRLPRRVSIRRTCASSTITKRAPTASTPMRRACSCSPSNSADHAVDASMARAVELMAD